MRNSLSAGHEDSTLLLYVGRLGVEKKLYRLKAVLEHNSVCRLVLVGQGPAENSLRKHFEGLPVHFAGQLVGTEEPRCLRSCGGLLCDQLADHSFNIVLQQASS
jgi:hypothetical protein